MLIEFHGINKHSGRDDNYYIDVLQKFQNIGFTLLLKIERVHYFVRDSKSALD